MMSFEQMKKIAHINKHECIMDRDGDICIRPMIFTEEGIKQNTLWPYPCEFRSRSEAEDQVNSFNCGATKG